MEPGTGASGKDAGRAQNGAKVGFRLADGCSAAGDAFASGLQGMHAGQARELRKSATEIQTNSMH